jgi:hypothetical protein
LGRERLYRDAEISGRLTKQRSDGVLVLGAQNAEIGGAGARAFERLKGLLDGDFGVGAYIVAGFRQL